MADATAHGPSHEPVADGAPTPPAVEPGTFPHEPDSCDLCEAARITPWYHSDDVCWIAECEICAVPMVVWRFHGTQPPDAHRAHMLAAIDVVASERVGEWYLDDNMRNIPDHWHAHARPKGGFFGHYLARGR